MINNNIFKVNKNPKKPKPPKPPRCLCSCELNVILGILSPSLCFAVHNEETAEYWRKVEDYQNRLMEYKIFKRIATKAEYKNYCRKIRRKKNERT